MGGLRSTLAFLLAAAMAVGIATPVTAVHADPRGGRVEPLLLVVSPELRLRDISMAVVRRVFRGEPTHLAGHRLIPFNYPVGNPVRKAFDETALGMSPDAVGRYWVDRKIRGQAPPPRTVPNAAYMLAIANRLVGAIGYVPAASHNPDKVRALTVDGHSYTSPNYPLCAAVEE